MKPIKCHLCQGDDCLQNDIVSPIITKFCWSQKGKCFTSIDLTNEALTHQRGCIDAYANSDLMCRHNNDHVIHNNLDAYLRCCSTELCNNEEFMFAKSDISDEELPLSSSSSMPHSMLMLKYSAFLIVLILVILLVILLFWKKKTRLKKLDFDHESNLLGKLLLSNHKDDKSGKTLVKPQQADNISGDTIDEFTSGSGKMLLDQRTFAKNINLIQTVGKGRYGEVWKGIFHYEEVAVKIFLTRDEASFKREEEIYSNSLHKHENILTFIGSDVISKNACTQLWLVTTYHELGSLFDYLSHHTISMDEMFSIMTSIASGLVFLHNEKFGTQKKPAIAHRDIKSKNILMKSKHICCIADFGLAVTKTKAGDLNIARNHRVGTKRYMAPEVLDETFNDKNFDSYKNADIYSFSLVLWEIIRRVERQNSTRALNYEVPYQFKVPNDPSFEDMRKLVSVDKYRPEIPIELEHYQNLGLLCKIIREGWSKNPSSRLSALRIKKTLIHLKQPISTTGMSTTNLI